MRFIYKIYKYTLLFVVVMISHSCLKDLGNYEYLENLNEPIVSDLDTLYVVRRGETLTLKPKISLNNRAIDDYKFEWIVKGLSGYLPNERLIGEGASANIQIDESFDYFNYDFILRITDKKTGVFNDFPFNVIVYTDSYEGWLVLSEVENQKSRLDMISYHPLTKKYTYINNVLQRYGSTLKLDGTPCYIKFFNINNSPITNGTYDAILLGTSKFSTYLGADTLNYDPFWDLKYYSVNSQNISFGSGARAEDVIGNSTCILANGNAITFDRNSFNGKYQAINKRRINGTLQTFKAAPFVSLREVNYEKEIILFDTDSSEFLYYNGFYNPCVEIENGKLFNNKIKKDLIFMRKVAYDGGTTFAVLKDNNGVYLARFKLKEQISFDKLDGTFIPNAGHIEVSGEYGYIFYSVGGKLYQYNFALNQNKLMADYGDKIISHIKFHSFQDVFMNNRYEEMQKKLIVCTYDEMNISTSGVMDFYTVPARGEQIIKESTYSGFGKIKDITYRMR